MRRIKDLIFSDLHLPQHDFRLIVPVIKTHSFKRLILLGDVFCSFNAFTFRNYSVSFIKRSQLEFFGYLSRLYRERPELLEIIIIRGNHDWLLGNYTDLPEGIIVADDLTVNRDGKIYHYTHGDEFKRLTVNRGFVCTLTSQINPLLRWVDKEQKLRHRANHWYIKVKHPSRKLIKRAYPFVRKRGIDYFFFGHTHDPLKLRVGKTVFINTGSLDNGHIPYGVVRRDGIPDLRFYAK